MTRSSAELHGLLVELMSLHPIREFKQIMDLNDKMRLILEKQREVYENTNLTSFDEQIYKKDFSFVSFFNNYMEYVTLANYMYPFTHLAYRFILELEILTSKHVYAEKTNKAAGNVKNANHICDESIYVSLIIEHCSRSNKPEIKAVHRNYKLFTLGYLHRQRRMDYSGMGATSVDIGTMQKQMKESMTVQLSPTEEKQVVEWIDKYLLYHYSYKKAHYGDLLTFFNNDLAALVYPAHIIYQDLLQPYLIKAYKEHIRIDPSFRSKSHLASPIYINHESYRKNFRTDFIEWFRYHPLPIQGDEKPPLFLQSIEDVQTSLLVPIYFNGTFDAMFGPYFFSLWGAKHISRQEFYEIVSSKLYYTITPRVLEREDDDDTVKTKPARSTPKSKKKEKKKKETEQAKVAANLEEPSDEINEVPESHGSESTSTNSEPAAPKESPIAPTESKKKKERIAQKLVPEPNSPKVYRPKSTCESLDSYKSSQAFTHTDFELYGGDMKTLCIVYGEGKGIVKWQSFTRLLSELGFRMEKDRAGSRVGFVLDKMKNIPLVVHQPHPVNVMSRLMLKVAMKKLEEIGIVPQKFRVAK